MEVEEVDVEEESVGIVNGRRLESKSGRERM